MTRRSSPHLHVLGRGHRRAQARGDDLRRLRSVFLCGSVADNAWVADVLEARGIAFEAHPSLAHLPRLLERNGAAVVVMEATAPHQGAALDAVRGLDARMRRRILVLCWRPAWRLIRQFVEAGVPDFVKMPAAGAELALRIELRARDVRLPHVAERHHPGMAPDVNALSGGIGSGVRLSDREYLLYDLLAQRFGEVVPRAEILQRIWGRRPGAGPSTNIVDVYVRYLRVKLERAAPELTIVTIRHVGYVLERKSGERPR